jgi:hypothetical protein
VVDRRNEHAGGVAHPPTCRRGIPLPRRAEPHGPGGFRCVALAGEPGGRGSRSDPPHAVRTRGSARP